MDPETNTQRTDLDDSFTFTPVFHYLTSYFNRAAESAHVAKVDWPLISTKPYQTTLDHVLKTAYDLEQCPDSMLTDVFMVIVHAMMQMYAVNPGAMKAAADRAQGVSK